MAKQQQQQQYPYKRPRPLVNNDYYNNNHYHRYSLNVSVSMILTVIFCCNHNNVSSSPILFVTPIWAFQPFASRCTRRKHRFGSNEYMQRHFHRHRYVVNSNNIHSSTSKKNNNNNNSNMIDIEDIIDDPEFIDRKSHPRYTNYKLDDNYDNDFDTSAFQSLNTAAVDDGGAQLYSCVVNYDTMGNGDVAALPYMSRLDSDSTWIIYGTNDDEVVQPAGQYGQFKESLANALKDPRVEVTVAFSVLLSCLLVAISTFENFSYRNLLLYIEDGITAIFALDFFGRWMSSNKDFGQHVFNLQFAIDVVVVVIPLLFAILPDTINTSSLWIPEFMTSPSALINLLLLRVLRLRRVFQDLTTYTKFERALGIRNSVGIQVWQLQLARVLFSLFTLLSVSTGLIYTAEHDVNPSIPNYFTALYFSISTLATLGLGDITPITWQGRLVVCATIVAGVAIVPAQAATLVEALVSRKDNNSKEELQKKEQQRPTTRSNVKHDDTIVNGSQWTTLSTTISKTNNNMGTTDNGRFVLEIETTLQCPNCSVSMHWSAAQYCWSCGTALTSKEE